MLIKSAENPSHFYHLSGFSNQACSACLTQVHANRAIIRTLTTTYGTLQKNKRSSVLNLPKQRQVCPSLFFQFNMRISVIYGTLSVSCKRVVRVLSPLASNSCGGSHIWKSYIHNSIIILSWVNREAIQRPAPSWLVGLIIGRAMTYQRGQEFKSCTSLNIFRLSFCNYSETCIKQTPKKCLEWSTCIE